MALTFDGSDDKIDYGSGMITPVANGFSAAAWVNLGTGADVANDNRTIMSISPNVASGDHNFSWAIGNWTASDDTKQEFATYSGGWTVAASNTHLELYGWHHVAFTYDGANVRFYLDGAPDGAPAFTVSCFTGGTQLFRIGTTLDALISYAYAGRMAAPAYWQRVLTDAEILALAKVRTSPLKLATGLKYYATLYSRDDADGGAAEFVRNQVDGVAGTLTGTTTSSNRNNPPLRWRLVKIVSSQSDGNIDYQTGTIQQCWAGTSSGAVNDTSTGSDFQPWGHALSPYVAEVFMSFGTDRLLPRDAFIETVSFFWRCLYDNNFTSTEVCEVREYEWGNEVAANGETYGTLTLADWIPTNNLGNYTLLATKVFSGGLQEGNVWMESKCPTFRGAIKRDKPTQIVIASDRQRNQIEPTDDETVHPAYSEHATADYRPKLFVLYHREGQFDRRVFPRPLLKRGLQ